MFCFFNCFSDAVAVGDAERLRLLGAGAGAGAESESEDEVEVEIEIVVVVRLVLAVEGFWVEVAWRVALESLEICGIFGVVFEVDFDIIFVGWGGLEKSISSESLLEELVAEESEDEEDAFAAAGAAVGCLGSELESLSDDEVSEEEDASFLIGVAFSGVAAGFGA